MDTNIDLANLDTATLIQMILDARNAAPVVEVEIPGLAGNDAPPTAPTTGDLSWGEAHIVAPGSCHNAGMTVDGSTVRSYNDATLVRLAEELHGVFGDVAFTTSQAWDGCAQFLLKRGGTGPRFKARDVFGVAMNRANTRIESTPSHARVINIVGRDGRACVYRINPINLAWEVDRLNKLEGKA